MDSSQEIGAVSNFAVKWSALVSGIRRDSRVACGEGRQLVFKNIPLSSPQRADPWPPLSPPFSKTLYLLVGRMDYLKSNYEASSGFGSLQPHTTDFTQHSYPLFCEYTHSPAFHLPPPGVLPVQYAPSPYNPPGIVTAQANFHLPPAVRMMCRMIYGRLSKKSADT